MPNFYQRFTSTAARFPGRVAVELQHRDRLESFTYAELERMAERAAAWLAARGLKPGERAALLADNDAHWCAAYLGTMRVGGVAVPLDTNYKPKQVATLLEDSGARVLFASPRLVETAREGAQAAGASLPIVVLHGEAAGVESFEAILNAPAAPVLGEPTPPCPAGSSDPAAVFYSSGTTGDPKGVVLTHANLLGEIDGVLQVLRVDENDCVLGVLPLFHVLAHMANLLIPFVTGARVVFLETVNTGEVLRAFAERNVSLFCVVPQFFYLIRQRVWEQAGAAGWAARTAFGALLRLNGGLRGLAGLNLGPLLFRRVHRVFGPRMRLLVSGGSRFDPGVARDFYRLGLDILQGYGLTETSGAATLTRPGELWIDTVGTPLPGVEVRILPREAGADSEAPDSGGHDGEVAVRGAVVMQGYFNRPDATAAALEAGWLRTGDLGRLDERGRLSITGRQKEIIVLSSGKNIYPEEIEGHYQQSPFVKELCVLGQARAEEPAAERLHAVVVPDLEAMQRQKIVNLREILRFELETLSVQLPSHKRVLSFDVWMEELPRTTTRKLKRFEIERRLRERAGTSEAPAEERTLSEEEVAWEADPHAARALEAIRQAAQHKGEVRPDSNLELDLGFDSMERVELLAHLEELFGAHVPDETASRIYTVRELVEALRPSGAAGAGAAGRRGDAWSKLFEEPIDDPEILTLEKPKTVSAMLIFLLMKACYLVARVLFRFRVEGREHLPPRGPYLLCPNHQSYLDPFLLISALPFGVYRQLFIVGASEYFATPLTRWVARQANLVAVDPDANLLRAMQAAAFGLRHGRILLLFPEGERTADGEVKKFKKGAAILSAHLRAPIVPVALEGAFEVWPRGKSLQRLAPVRMRIGAPLPPPAPLPANASLADAEAHYAKAAERLRDVVSQLRERLRRPAAAYGGAAKPSE